MSGACRWWSKESASTSTKGCVPLLASLRPNLRGRRLSLLVAVPLAALLLYLALRGVNWPDLWQTVRHAQPRLLVLAFLASHLAYLLRSLRWRVLLTAERPVPVITVFWATMLGYLGNNALPARAGEFIRSAALGHKTGLSKSWVFATALTERLLDMVALVLLAGAALAAQRIAVSNPEAAWLVQAWRVLAALALLGLAFALVLPRVDSALKKRLSRAPLTVRFRDRWLAAWSQFLLGMRAFQHPRRAFGFAVLTFAIWLIDGLGTVVCARALGLGLNLPVALLLLAGLGLSGVVPSTPGYVGVYQFVAVTILPQFGFSRSSALALILVAQSLSYVAVLTWGLVGLWRLQAQPVAGNPATRSGLRL